MTISPIQHVSTTLGSRFRFPERKEVVDSALAAIVASEHVIVKSRAC